MFVKFFRENRIWSYFSVILRLYVGWEFLKAGHEKLTQGFNSTGFLKGAAAKATGEHPAVQGWWADFLNNFAIPNSGLFNFLVPWGEFLVGIALIVGIFTTFAAVMGATMNFAFMFSGTTSTNPQMVLLEVFIIVAGFNAAKIGLDYWVIPFVKRFWNTKIQHKDEAVPHHQ